MAGHVAQEPVVGANGVVQAVLDPDQVGGEGRKPHVVDQGHRDRSLRRAVPELVDPARSGMSRGSA